MARRCENDNLENDHFIRSQAQDSPDGQLCYAMLRGIGHRRCTDKCGQTH